MESGFIVVNPQLQTPNPRMTARSPKPVRRHPKKRISPSALARSRRRHARFLEKKLAGKLDLPSPEDQQDSVCVKEVENTCLVCGSNR